MGVYLYCLSDPRSVPPGELQGLAGARVERLVCDRLTAWSSELAERPQPSIERIRIHNEVVSAALNTGSTPLPLRWGHWVASEAAAERQIREHADAYLAALQRIANAVEYGVRVLDPRQRQNRAGGAAETGRAYLEAAAHRQGADRAHRSRAMQLGDELTRIVGDAARASRIEPLPTTHGVVSVAFLVPRQHETSYLERVERVREVHPELRFMFTGPWPPYSFAQ